MTDTPARRATSLMVTLVGAGGVGFTVMGDLRDRGWAGVLPGRAGVAEVERIGTGVALWLL
ncbi:hypothetical protein GCM10008939_13840 [Deinococcus aquiradiocola]|uniref:Uncharacterized protein n=1 Tax=Deinococcus aquiradiocola TaxID=393059 RepID=A0A917PC77_9DEIO|nr:hypothetical protein GCM10008939_13840 [Deinococcus aquiradiocola]